MLRALVLATLLFAVPNAVWAQPLGVLHIKVVVLDTEGKVTSVPRHALLISDNPSSKVARAAAQTQGMALPPIKRFRSDLERKYRGTGIDGLLGRLVRQSPVILLPAYGPRS